MVTTRLLAQEIRIAPFLMKRVTGDGRRVRVGGRRGRGRRVSRRDGGRRVVRVVGHSSRSRSGTASRGLLIPIPKNSVQSKGNRTKRRTTDHGPRMTAGP